MTMGAGEEISIDFARVDAGAASREGPPLPDPDPAPLMAHWRPSRRRPEEKRRRRERRRRERRKSKRLVNGKTEAGGFRRPGGGL